jgi:hypothetical protein
VDGDRFQCFPTCLGGGGQWWVAWTRVFSEFDIVCPIATIAGQRWNELPPGMRPKDAIGNLKALGDLARQYLWRLRHLRSRAAVGSLRSARSSCICKRIWIACTSSARLANIGRYAVGSCWMFSAPGGYAMTMSNSNRHAEMKRSHEVIP